MGWGLLGGVAKYAFAHPVQTAVASAFALPYIGGMPERTADELVQSRLKDDPDNFREFTSKDANPLQRVILAGNNLLGGNSSLDLENLDDKHKKERQRQIENDPQVSTAIGLINQDTRTPAASEIPLGMSLAQARAKFVPQGSVAKENIAIDLDTARSDAGMDSKAGKAKTKQQDLQMQMLINQANARLDETVNSRIDSNNLLRLQLANAKEAHSEKMYNYREQYAQKMENDRYRTTAGLIGGLSALGAAFAL